MKVHPERRPVGGQACHGGHHRGGVLAPPLIDGGATEGDGAILPWRPHPLAAGDRHPRRGEDAFAPTIRIAVKELRRAEGVDLFTNGGRSDERGNT